MDSPKLTVCEPYTTGSEFPPETEATRTRPSTWLIVVRWIVAILIALAFLVCLMASKLSILTLGLWLNVNNTNAFDDESAVDENFMASSFLLFLLAIVSPYVCSLIQCIIEGACQPYRLWPCWKAIFWGLLASVLESSGIVLFAMGTLSANHADVTILVMNGVYVLPIISHFVDEWRTNHHGFNARIKPWIKKTLLIFLFLIEVGGIALTIALQWRKFNWNTLTYDNVFERAQLPVSLLLLSAAWLPHLQKRQLYPREADFRKSLQRKIPLSADRPFEPPQRSEDVKMDDVIFTHPEFSCRWKISAITNFLRVVFVVTGCCVFVHVTNLVDFRYVDAPFQSLTPSHPLFPAFAVSVACSAGGNILAFVGRAARMQYISFACPLILSSLLSYVAIILYDECLWPFYCQSGWWSVALQVVNRHWALALPAGILLLGAQIALTVVLAFKTRDGMSHRAPVQVQDYGTKLFSMPGYNSMFLEQVLLLGQRTLYTNQRDINQRTDEDCGQMPKINVIMCSTMYRESAHEMEQLLKSIRAVKEARQGSKSNFESHIYLDNGVNGTKLTKFALQLLCKVKSTLGIKVSSDDFTKVATPYGMRLAWNLPSVDLRRRGMPFHIHLKDNQKVKNKKRWSQVMCMSYVVDWFLKNETDATLANTFILSTDADVEFSPKSVEAMLDLMVRDNRVGAVCARTYPVGSGPVYWYQVFDYAVGHWLQKATNHVLGSVLCCQGCFSVYRAEAIRQILPQYASQVETASEILTKDLGEDRWLSTLMIQNGWRLQYCSAASNSTSCPVTFNEFFKQRRRWIQSTLANQILLLQEWRTVVDKGISFYFLFYQAMLLFTTLISPALLIVIIIGSLTYGVHLEEVTSYILLVLTGGVILVTIAFFVVCLKARPGTQLVFAELVSCSWALLMAWIVLGTILSMVDENSPISQSVKSTWQNQPVPDNVTVSYDDVINGATTYSTTTTSSIVSAIGFLLTETQLSTSVTFLIVVVAVTVFVALMHPSEAYCLVYGLWYLLFLPTGYFVLLLYSICNLTDVSWGTREDRKIYKPSEPWHVTAGNFLAICCKRKTETEASKITDPVKAVVNQSLQNAASTLSTADVLNAVTLPDFADTKESQVETKPSDIDIETILPISLRLWLPQNLQSLYVQTFEENGYEDSSFLYGLDDRDLVELGIAIAGHRRVLLDAIAQLPEPEIEPCIAECVPDWLVDIGLSDYVSNFKKTHFASRACMETIMKRIVLPDDVVKELCIRKKGHQQRMLFAISKLRYPTAIEEAALMTKYELNAVTGGDMQKESKQEYDFWYELRNRRLHPDPVSALDHELKEKLKDLRNHALLALIFVNAFWLVVILSLLTESSRQVLGTNLLVLLFLVVFGLIFGTQFLCMIVHRCLTWMHMTAGIPWKCGKPYYSGWMFNDNHGRLGRPGPMNIQNNEHTGFLNSAADASEA